MSAAQATLEALDPSNSSKNTLKIENVSPSIKVHQTDYAKIGL